MKQKTITVKEFSEKLGISHDMVTRWIKEGKLKGKKKNVFSTRNSPILIPLTELQRIQNLINEK